MKQNERTRRFDQLVEVREGVLLFNHLIRPVFCNKMVNSLCQQVCKSGVCVLEEEAEGTPELFKIIGKFQRDCEPLFHSGGLHRRREFVPDFIVYLSPVGTFTVHCVRLDKEGSRATKALWQINLLRGMALTSLDFEIIDRKYGLTHAELKVVKHSIRGLSSAEIARQLVVSHSTAKMHLRHIFKKLDIVRRSQILSKLI